MAISLDQEAARTALADSIMMFASEGETERHATETTIVLGEVSEAPGSRPDFQGLLLLGKRTSGALVGFTSQRGLDGARD